MGTEAGSGGEASVWGRKFWDGVQTADEAQVIATVLRRRFPATYPLLNECLEATDPEDVVHPGNPDEYDDVAAEAIAQLAWHDSALASVSRVDLERLLRTSLRRCFPEPDLSDGVETARRESRLLVLVELVDQRRKDLPTDEGRPS